MKKVFLILFVLFLFIFIGCGKKINISAPDKVDVYVGEEIKLDLVLEEITLEELVFNVEDKSIAKCENGFVTGLQIGETNITISDGDNKVSKSVIVSVSEKPEIIINNSEKNLRKGKTLQLNVTVDKYEGEILYSSSDETVATVSSDGLVTGENNGKVTISVSCGRAISSIELVVVGDGGLFIIGGYNCYIGEKIELSCQKINVTGDVEWSVSDDTIASIDENGVLTALAEGEVIVIAVCEDQIAEQSLLINKDTIKPLITCEGKKNITIGYGSNDDVLAGLVATDNIDGDITSKITVSEPIDNRKYGRQSVTVSVTDSSGNVGVFIRQITVEWQYAVNFIGHAGCYYGVMNSEEAFLYAATVLKYQYIECDLKQSSDGVFLMCHDDTFGGYELKKNTWEFLKDIEDTKTRNSGFPKENGSIVKGKYTTKLCTLERYLEICRENNIIAVIELKDSPGITNSSQTKMKALMDEIERCGMIRQCVLLTSQYNCLIWTRQNGYDFIPCQYLTNSCESDTVLNRCIEYNLDVSINIDHKNSDAWLAKYKEKGIKISTFTFTQYVDYPVVQQWINKGVDFVTVDWHVMDNLKLPLKNKEDEIRYNGSIKEKEEEIITVSNILDVIKSKYL